jgi:hypothetical protein
VHRTLLAASGVWLLHAEPEEGSIFKFPSVVQLTSPQQQFEHEADHA